MAGKNRSAFWGSWGVAFAYASWGLLTVFWNMLADVGAVYVLMQRIIWSAVFMGVYLVVTKHMDEVIAVFRDKKRLGMCFLCGVMVSINWGVYIYAVTSGQVLQASLGYFIEPVLVGLIGLLVFRERPSVLEMITFGFAVLGLSYMVLKNGTFPFVAVIIAGSFAIYGALKKTIEITPHTSLFMETLLMSPFAFAYVVYADMNGMGSVGVLHGAEFWLLPACGVVTSIPLLFFNIGVKAIPYYVSGILMYINPTLQFVMGLFYFHEAMDWNRFVAFCLIWFGILFAVWDKLRLIWRDRQKKRSMQTEFVDNRA